LFCQLWDILILKGYGRGHSVITASLAQYRFKWKLFYRHFADRSWSLF